MVNNNTQGAMIVAHMSKGFIHFTSGSISSLNMNPTHSVRCITKDLEHNDLWSTDHPRAPLDTRGSNREAKIVEGCVISDEIGNFSRTSFTEGCFTLSPPFAWARLIATRASHQAS